MKNKKIQITLLYSLSLLMLLFACKKEQPEMSNEAKDPCDCASEISADFKIEESTGIFAGDFTETDTVYKNKWVYFTAYENEASYTWYIGLDVLTDQSVNRYFNDNWEGYDIPITLVVEKEPNSVCFPNDDGYDSITKTFHISQYPISTGIPFSDIDAGPIEGKYRVKSSHLPDSFDIELNLTVDSQGGSGHFFNIINYNGYGDSCINQTRVKGMNYRQVWNNPPTGYCDNLYAVIHNRMDGVTEMKMSWIGDGTGLLTYYGRKIN